MDRTEQWKAIAGRLYMSMHDHPMTDEFNVAVLKDYRELRDAEAEVEMAAIRNRIDPNEPAILRRLREMHGRGEMRPDRTR